MGSTSVFFAQDIIAAYLGKPTIDGETMTETT